MGIYSAVAHDLISSLELSLPPTAASFLEDKPAGIPSFDGIVPAGCAFWQKAAAQTFVTSTKDHELCAIGIYTHNMSQPSQSHQGELRGALQAMSGLDYVREAEVAAIPVMQRAVKFAMYGPLADFSDAPDVVLLFAHAQQGLIISEAVARVDSGAPVAMGRPACAVIPQVVNNRTAALSLGCCGARAYIDAMSDSTALWAFPGSKIERYCAEIKILAAANKTLTSFHQLRREDVESGKRPTIQQSLARLS